MKRGRENSIHRGGGGSYLCREAGWGFKRERRQTNREFWNGRGEASTFLFSCVCVCVMMDVLLSSLVRGDNRECWLRLSLGKERGGGGNWRTTVAPPSTKLETQVYLGNYACVPCRKIEQTGCSSATARSGVSEASMRAAGGSAWPVRAAGGSAWPVRAAGKVSRLL